MKTKKEIKELLDAGKLNLLKKHVITDGTKKDMIDALYLLFNYGGGEYTVEFETLPYSRGGKYRRHTTTLHSVQKWEVKEFGVSGFSIETSSTSKSAACPPVIMPKFYTEAGKHYFNNQILVEIEKLKSRLLK